jgi:hypothetical protein
MLQMAKRTEYRSSFTANEIETGRPRRLDIFVDVLDVATFGDPTGETDGLKKLMTSDRQHVNYIKKGEYQIVGGPALRSDDPNAP